MSGFNPRGLPSFLSVVQLYYSTGVLLLHFVKLVVHVYYGRFDYWTSTCVLSTITAPPLANVIMSRFPNK